MQTKKGSSRPGAGRVAKAGPGRQVRIIGGQWKRTPLEVLDAEGLRPTPDRVRETVFNWLGHLLVRDWEQIECLDLFAGSGALGFEAASRGARRVTMVEKHTPALKQIEVTKEKLRAENIRIVRGDALGVAQQLVGTGDCFHLIFLDPPYHEDWLARLLPLCHALLHPGGLVYVELEHGLAEGQTPAWLDNWEVLRADKAGMVCYHLIRSNNPTINRA